MHTKPDEWVKKLSQEGPEQSEALLDLGVLLSGRVARAFRSESRVGEAFVDDVVQDSLMKILASLDQFEGKSQFTTWATTIAVRTAVGEMRRLRWKDTSLNQLMEKQGASAEGASSDASPEEKASSSQLVATMYKIINEQLTDKQREILLAQLSGMPQAEIGRRMGSNRNAIYKLGYDARQRLKQGLLEAGYSAEDLDTFEVTQ